MSDVIDAIGHSPPQGMLKKIVDVDCLCLATPGTTRILEVANQFFLLGVDTDHRMPGSQEELLDLIDVAKLTMPIGMRRTNELFPVDLQGVVQLLEQPSDGAWSDQDGLYLSVGGAFMCDDIQIWDYYSGTVYFFDDIESGKNQLSDRLGRRADGIYRGNCPARDKVRNESR